MRERPKELKALSLILVLIAVSLPVQVMLLYGESPFQATGTIFKLAPMNWIVMLVAVLNAALVYQASRWVLLTAPLFIMTVAWNNWLVADSGLNFSTESAAVATIGVIVIHAALLTRSVRLLLQKPNMRWWRTAPRKRASVRAVICPVMGGELVSRTFDISSGGAFFPLADANWTSMKAPPFRNLHVGARCSVRLMLGQLHMINCTAEIVRHASEKGAYPSGFGVRFLALDSEQKRILSQFLDRPEISDAPYVST